MGVVESRMLTACEDAPMAVGGLDEMLKRLAADGMLVKRPLLVGDDFMLVGFKEAEWESRLKTQ